MNELLTNISFYIGKKYIWNGCRADKYGWRLITGYYNGQITFQVEKKEIYEKYNPGTSKFSFINLIDGINKGYITLLDNEEEEIL